MINKNYCMSSYLAFRYIEKDDMDFFENSGKHCNIVPIPDKERIPVHSSQDIDVEIRKQIENIKGKKKIDFLKFMDDVFSIESSSSYMNAFSVAEMSYYDPYAKLKMADPLDLNRIRQGEAKYLIRSLMTQRYPDIPVPNKIPMPRPVDIYFADWKGPGRPEFRKDIDMSKYSGNQKWQMYCLERFLNMYD